MRLDNPPWAPQCPDPGIRSSIALPQYRLTVRVIQIPSCRTPVFLEGQALTVEIADRGVGIEEVPVLLRYGVGGIENADLVFFWVGGFPFVLYFLQCWGVVGVGGGGGDVRDDGEEACCVEVVCEPGPDDAVQGTE